MGTKIEDINKIETALCDPKAPWYGSDLVGWVGDLLDAHKQLVKKYDDLNNVVQISCNPPDDCNDPVVLKTYMKGCFDLAFKDAEIRR